MGNIDIGSKRLFYRMILDALRKEVINVISINPFVVLSLLACLCPANSFPYEFVFKFGSIEVGV